MDCLIWAKNHKLFTYIICLNRQNLFDLHLAMPIL